MNKCLVAILGLCMVAAPSLPAGDARADGVLLKGGDISMLPRLEELGAVYRDDGKPADAIGIMMRSGGNCFRVRLFVNPTMKNAVVQDLDYVVKLAQRVKKAGAVLLLDIHYSDTWADPSHQNKPAVWRDLPFEELEAKVESYTTEVIATLRKAGCLPDIVQVGNEITPGFLWPEGKLHRAKEGGWGNFARLLKAGIRGVKAPLGAEDKVRTMVHIDKGGNARATSWFFGNLAKHKVEFDMIGLSYYPWWHGGIEDLRRNLKQTAARFGKPIVVVETAYPWREWKHDKTKSKNMDWPQTLQGQKQFLQDVIEAVQATPQGLGRGVLWWYPESIPNQSLRIWKGGRMALFGTDGNGQPALDAFRADAPAAADRAPER